MVVPSKAFLLAPATAYNSKYQCLSEPQITTDSLSNVLEGTVGSYDIGFVASPYIIGGLSSHATQTYMVADTTAPIIVCPQDATVIRGSVGDTVARAGGLTITHGSKSHDSVPPGTATATDQCDGAMSDQIVRSGSPTNKSPNNQYVETFSVIDHSGNNASCTRTIDVVSPPTSAPTKSPTFSPTKSPTFSPTFSPTTSSPTHAPTQAPTHHICKPEAGMGPNGPCDTVHGICDEVTMPTDATVADAPSSADGKSCPDGWSAEEDRCVKHAVGCSNYVDALLSEHKSTHTVESCAKLCTETAGCLEFSFGVSQRWADGSCALLQKPCITAGNTNHDLYSARTTVAQRRRSGVVAVHQGTFKCSCAHGYECSDLRTLTNDCLTCAMTAAPTNSPTSKPSEAPTSVPTNAPTFTPTSHPTMPVRPECVLLGDSTITVERCAATTLVDTRLTVDQKAHCTNEWDDSFPRDISYTAMSASPASGKTFVASPRDTSYTAMSASATLASGKWFVASATARTYKGGQEWCAKQGMEMGVVQGNSAGNPDRSSADYQAATAALLAAKGTWGEPTIARSESQGTHAVFQRGQSVYMDPQTQAQVDKGSLPVLALWISSSGDQKFLVNWWGTNSDKMGVVS